MVSTQLNLVSLDITFKIIYTTIYNHPCVQNPTFVTRQCFIMLIALDVPPALCYN